MDVEAIEKLIAEQYKGKDKLIAPNIEALHIGRNWAHGEPRNARSACACSKADKVGDRIFIEGNAAAALGAVYGGATVCAWYPLTPSTSLAEGFTSYCKRLRGDKETGKNKYAIVQCEDELASIGVVIGAGWNGSRAFTATSGPGVSLMQEFLGLAYFAEIPAVLFNVQRGGPSTGMPTRTQQSDFSPAPTPRTATPSTCCCSREIPAKPSNSARCRSISPIACRRRSSSCSISRSA